jgi:hypothetical protein
MPKNFPPSEVREGHPDFVALTGVRLLIEARAGGPERLSEELPALLKNAVDFVLDPVTTARTSIADLDKVEKTFIGLKVEHYIRDMLDLPRGLRRDVSLDGLDVDIKNTIGSSWMIPPESYGGAEPCILIANAKFEGRCSLGVMLARQEYLGAPNRDQKRPVTVTGKRNILWLVDDAAYPLSRWVQIDMTKFRALRRVKGGNKRAAQFFREHLGLVIHRSIVEALLHDQQDFMRRLRGDKNYVGARDILKRENIVLACGVWKESRAACEGAGFAGLAIDEWVAFKVASAG